MTRTEVWIATTASRREWALVATLPGNVEPRTAARLAASLARSAAYRLNPLMGSCKRLSFAPWWARPTMVDVRTVET
jgi:hypothetical protein